MSSHPQSAELRTAARRVFAGEAERITVHEPDAKATIDLLRSVQPPDLDENASEEMMDAFGSTLERAMAMSDAELEAYERELDEQGGEAKPASLELSTYVPEGERRQITSLKKLGFHERDANNGWVEYVRTVADADEAADFVCRVLTRVMRIDPSAWLWITDLKQSDWPNPLPRPKAWPAQVNGRAS